MSTVSRASRPRSLWAAVSVNVALVLGFFWFGLRPAPLLLQGANHRDKVWHFLGFGLLALSHVLLTRRLWPLRAPWAAAVLSMGWGILLEIAQAFVPSRSADLLDAVADAAGACAAAWLVSSWGARRQRGS